MKALPSPIRFDELRAFNPGRLSDRAPVVCLEEDGQRPDVVRGYRHGDFMSVYVARQGRGTHVVESVPFAIRAGDVYAMGPGMAHRFAEPEGLVLDTVHFKPSLFSAETQRTLAAVEGLAPLFLGAEDPGASRWHRLAPADHAQVLGMMREMRDEWTVDAPDRDLMVRATFLRLLVFLARSRRASGLVGTGVVARARRHIELRYAEPLRIADLAAAAFLSLGRFTEVFGAEVGCSPREHLGRVRLRAAQALLRETDLPVAEVALRTGFADPAYFTRFFRAHVGLSPSEFRRGRAGGP